MDQLQQEVCVIKTLQLCRIEKLSFGSPVLLDLTLSESTVRHAERLVTSQGWSVWFSAESCQLNGAAVNHCYRLIMSVACLMVSVRVISIRFAWHRHTAAVSGV